jgi:hypothetical protein
MSARFGLRDLCVNDLEQRPPLCGEPFAYSCEGRFRGSALGEKLL